MRLARIALVAVVSAVAVGLGIYAFFVEPDRLVVRRDRLALLGWPAPLKIAVISDLHVGSPFIDVAKVERLVALSNAEAPDLVLLCGDYVARGIVGGHRVPVAEFAPTLGGLRARYGVWAVLGNHDWWVDGPGTRSAFEAAGIHVLDDQIARLVVEGHSIWLLGVADSWTRYPRPDLAIQRIPDHETILAFAHNPDVFAENMPDRVILTFAGHTHGGQVNLPLIGRPIVPSAWGQRYAFGHVWENGHHLYVTSGVGTSNLPVRFRVPPEIALVDVVPR